MMSQTLCPFLVGLLFPVVVGAQGSDFFPGPSVAALGSDARPLTFASVSIEPGDATGSRTIQMSQATGTFVATNVTLKDLLAFAYSIDRVRLLDGPDWVDTDEYNIVAQAPADLDPEIHPDRIERVMLRGMLWDLFEVDLDPINRWHFSLTVDQSTGPKFSESTIDSADEPEIRYEESGGSFPGVGERQGRVIGRRATMSALAKFMEESAGAPVVNRTDLSGRYDFEFYWNENWSDSAVWRNRLRNELGLHLRRTPVQYFVIDRAKKPRIN